jgi:hypothetical protein
MQLRLLGENFGNWLDYSGFVTDHEPGRTHGISETLAK